MKVTFSINLYDYEGDIYQEGIYLHYDNGFIIRLKSLEELDEMIENLQSISKEIKEQGAR